MAHAPQSPPKAPPRPSRIRFGTFEADLRSGELLRAGARVRIQSQPFKVLTALLESPGEVVSREELQQRVWGSATTVDFDHSLGIAINKLRDALGDSAENPRFVETLSRRGYRFIAPVSSVTAPVSPEAQPLPPEYRPESRITAPQLLSTHPAAPAPAEPSPVPSPSLPSRGLVPSEPASAPASTFPVDLPLRTPVFTPRGIGLALLGLLLLALLAIATRLWLRSTPVKVRHLNRVTWSGRVLEPNVDLGNVPAAATDDTRLFFSQTENAQTALAQALIVNGDIDEFRLPSEISAPVISALSPDKASLLVHNQLVNESEVPFWIVPTLGNPQRIPNLLAHDATWMPDGRQILYAQGNALYITRRDGTETRKFADLPGWAFWLRWSPDGTRLRFSLRDPGHQTSTLWDIASDGHSLHALLPGWSSPGSECCGSWTADGKQFVFQSRHAGRSDLWLMRDGLFGSAAPSQLTNGPLDFLAPVTGTRDHRVYFVGSDPEIQLLQYNASSRQFMRLEGTFTSAALTTFSQDGQWVAWLNTMDGSLWRSRADGSDRLQLTTPPLRIFMMRWSPDNRQLAIMAEEPGNPWRVYLQDAAGGHLEPLLRESRNEADPTWSSDGQTIVLGRLPQGMSSESQPKTIYSVDVKTRRVTEIPGSAGLFSPRLSPDSRTIAALSLEQRSLMLFDRQSSTWRTLIQRSVADPLWSADGRAIYFQDDLEEGKPIYRVDVATGTLQQITRLGTLHPLAARDYRLVALAPGENLVVSAWTSNVNLYSIDLDE